MPFLEHRRTPKPARLAIHETQIRTAQEARKPWLDIWRTTYDYYCSDPQTAYDADGYRLHANLPFAWYESIWPSLAFTSPTFTAEPMSGETESAARLVSRAITSELRIARLRSMIHRATYDGLLYSCGIPALGYYGSGLIPSAEDAEKGSEDVSAKHSSDIPYGFRPGSIYVYNVRPHRFLVDPYATSLDDALWCGAEYVRPLSAVLADPQYINTTNLEANESELPEGMTIAQFKERHWRPPEMTFVRIVQLWDIVDRKVYAIAPGHGDYIGEWQMDALPVRRFPFYPFMPTDDFDSFWHQGPMVPWLNLTEEYNLAISSRLNHLARFKRKYVTSSDQLDPEEAAKLELPIDGLILRARGDARTAATPLQDANISPDSYAFTREAMDQWRFMSGMSELDQGGMRPGERPAAEIHRMAAGANARRQGLTSRLSFALEDLADDVRCVMERYYSKERMVSISGERGRLEWVKYDSSSLRGRYLWKCHIEDVAPKTQDERTAAAAQRLQFLAPFAPPVPLIDLSPQLVEAAREMGIRDLRFLPQMNPPMDPVAEWILLAEKAIPLQPNEMDDHAYHVSVHEAQLAHPQTFRDPASAERIRNHIMAHQAFLQSAQVAAEASAPTSPSGSSGRPGPAPGSTNNPTGGAGVFATARARPSAGTTGMNTPALMRGGQR